MTKVTVARRDQPTADSRARPEDVVISGDVQPPSPATHFPPDEIYVWKYPREHYACRISRPAAGGPPVTTLRRKMYFSAHDGGGKVEICARATLSFPAPFVFPRLSLATREPLSSNPPTSIHHRQLPAGIEAARTV